MDSEAERLVRIVALKNALDHSGKAQLDAVMSKLLGSRPDLRSSIKSLIPDIKTQVSAVNSMRQAEQKRMLEELAPGELGTKNRWSKSRPFHHLKAP